MTTILVIPDSHANADTDNRRYLWLGRFILERQPDIIVNLGDLFDMASLSSYDKGKKSFEGRRYKNDIDCGVDALQKMDQAWNDFNNKRKNIKKGALKPPRKIITLGNHEGRILRAVENSSELEGILSIDNLRLKEFNYEVYPFKSPVCVDGIYFNHYFPSGVLGQPISGVSIASSLIQKNLVSSVQGHTHTWDHAIRSRPDGTKVIGLCAGWYGEQATFEDATDQLWVSCITMLHDCHNGIFDIEQISIERIKREYS
jgi:hypothetical protein